MAIYKTRRQLEVLLSEHSIFLDLANTIAASPHKNGPEVFEAARTFIKDWGMLLAISADRSLSSTVEAFLLRARSMRRKLVNTERNGWRLRPEQMRSLRGVVLDNGLALQPRNLFDFCQLEFFAAVNAGLRFSRCENRECGKYVLRRELHRSGPNRKYCSGRCRKSVSRAKVSRTRAA
jgi:hypothetical protein